MFLINLKKGNFNKGMHILILKNVYQCVNIAHCQVKHLKISNKLFNKLDNKKLLIYNSKCKYISCY